MDERSRCVYIKVENINEDISIQGADILTALEYKFENIDEKLSGCVKAGRLTWRVFCWEEDFQEELLRAQTLKQVDGKWEASITRPIPSDIRTLIVTGYPIWERDLKLTTMLGKYGVTNPEIDSQKYRRFPNVKTGTKIVKWKGDKVDIPSEERIGNMKVYLRYSDEAPQKKCYKCGRIGHTSIECQEGTLCFICGERKHKSDSCPQRKDKDENVWVHVSRRGRMARAMNGDLNREHNEMTEKNVEHETNKEELKLVEVVLDNERFPSLEVSKANTHQSATPYKYADISPLRRNRERKYVFQDTMRQVREIAEEVLSECNTAGDASTSPETTIDEAFNRLQSMKGSNTSTPMYDDANKNKNKNMNAEDTKTMEGERISENVNEIIEVAEKKSVPEDSKDENQNNNRKSEEETQTPNTENERDELEIYDKQNGSKTISTNPNESSSREMSKRKRVASTPEKENHGILGWLRKGNKKSKKHEDIPQN